MSEWLNDLIEKIGKGKLIAESDICKLMLKLMEVLYDESNVLTLYSPLIICGDVHGQLYDVFELFHVATGGRGIGNNRFLFLGDYVDRGHFSVETFGYLEALKLKYPKQNPVSVFQPN